MFQKQEAADGSLTPFQAVCTALAATVGTGNIAGVAGAIAIGGPGAVFWMWISALLGMGTKFAEVTLAVHYRERNDKGDYVGGPMYYIQNGLGMKWLAMIFAFFVAIACLGTGNATQVNTIVASVNTALLSFNIIDASATGTVALIIGIAVAETIHFGHHRPEHTQIGAHLTVGALFFRQTHAVSQFQMLCGQLIDHHAEAAQAAAGGLDVVLALRCAALVHIVIIFHIGVFQLIEIDHFPNLRYALVNR